MDNTENFDFNTDFINRYRFSLYSIPTFDAYKCNAVINNVLRIRNNNIDSRLIIQFYAKKM